ncbi:MAG: N-acetyl sugar amidotransferase [Bacteroidetes bacterium]|nr:N-acetyl sugar amidotransferase [Bacteroidota bacterium]
MQNKGEIKNTFLFIVPRMPVRLRNSLREALYHNTIQSLLNQKCKNWRAIILGEKIKVSDIENEHLVYVEADDLPKTDKLKIALDYISSHPELTPEYIIRLDADDIICPQYLSKIENLSERYDLYYDEFHVCIDPVYLKISYRKNAWIANTAIHKYVHAIKPCGPHNEVLFLQDHDAFWHSYYADKKVFKSPKLTPLYYRILSPYSITSSGLDNNDHINWNNHLAYLNSYGPWISLHSSFFGFDGIKKVHDVFEAHRPKRPALYWLFNRVKFIRDRLIRHNIYKGGISVRSEVVKIPTEYQECTRCLLTTLDTSVITFDIAGLCSYCNYYESVTSNLGTVAERTKWITAKIAEIKKEGHGKEFDCILGVSGGVDSTFLSYWAKENGLRPLVVHFDNGWNSELATANIRNICEKLGLALNTHVINWEEFKELQLAYLRAGVIDMEALTDHAIMATIYEIAAKHKIRFTLNGFNFATEAIMPKSWVFDKSDWENIRDIYKKFGKGKKINTFPHLTFKQKLIYYWFLKLESIQVLNYIEYNKEEAKKLISEKLSWRDYGGKHYESVFTKFYQAYILPVRFGVDKRKAHLSNLICSKQISKKEALNELQKPLYNEQEFRVEKEYVLKKWELKEEEFDKIMKLPKRTHDEFKTEKKLWGKYFNLLNILKLRFK